MTPEAFNGIGNNIAVVQRILGKSIFYPDNKRINSFKICLCQDFFVS
jgi:hypothetical protein